MDRISYLPNPLRSHIVSFLPFKEAIRSSILSRKWRHLCSSLSNLDFRQLEQNRYEDREQFNSIIDRTLILHDGSDIRECCLVIRLAEYDSLSALHINTWICFALRHNVRKLKLTICSAVGNEDFEQLQLPCSLFNCSTLIALTLSIEDLKFPAIIRFPVLTKLKLWHITFPGEYITSKLFSDSSCPMLNDLLIGYCDLENFTTLNISFPNLKRFRLYVYEDDLQSYKINLSAPNLLKFGYKSSYPPNIIFKTFSSIVFATFNGHGYLSDLDVVDNYASKILMELRNVKTLALLGHFLEFLNRDPDFCSRLPTPYCNLKYLQLGMNAAKNQGHLLVFLLRSCPNIQGLTITYPWVTPTLLNVIGVENYWPSEEFLAGDLLKCLKTVAIEYFQGSESEQDIVRFLLQSASNLETMFIIWYYVEHENSDIRAKISQDLLSITRASPQAEVVFFSRDRVAYVSNS
ncbi:F-box protein [Thalictrum thalictroides]|uniref:F-box protein n=1 Tax=Thalictrum thalictroides TaxID=46969 RepID=A0A7J6VRT9_THATH|nr:F-box protein [Thalictrum thalictroides]